jgi:hypothetical protein
MELSPGSSANSSGIAQRRNMNPHLMILSIFPSLKISRVSQNLFHKTMNGQIEQTGETRIEDVKYTVSVDVTHSKDKQF